MTDTKIIGLLFTGCIITLLGVTIFRHYVLATPTAIVPHFQRGECFELNGTKEVWDVSPDGIIERVGKEHYLALFHEQANKNGGDKSASSLSIASFDQQHHKVVCPDSWVRHTHE